MIRRIFGILIMVLGASYAAWLLYDELIGHSIASQVRNPLPGLLLSFGIIFMGFNLLPRK